MLSTQSLYNLRSALLGVHIHHWTQEFYEEDQDTPDNWWTQSQNRRKYNFKQYSQAHRPSCICFCSFGSNIGQHFRNILLVLWNNPTRKEKISFGIPAVPQPQNIPLVSYKLRLCQGATPLDVCEARFNCFYKQILKKKKKPNQNQQKQL